jgi:hypothetical protein
MWKAQTIVTGFALAIVGAMVPITIPQPAAADIHLFKQMDIGFFPSVAARLITIRRKDNRGGSVAHRSESIRLDICLSKGPLTIGDRIQRERESTPTLCRSLH